jgi:hypothetical protein
VGGQPVRLPVLSVDDNEQWVERFNAEFASLLGELPGVESMAAASTLGVRGLSRMVDLLVAYDTTHVLGGADHLRATATPNEISVAFRKVLSAAFPFDNELVKFLMPAIRSVLTSQIINTALERSTKSQPPSTDGAPDSSDES